MPAASDTMLASGSAAHAAALHGETVALLTGPHAGREVRGVVIENEADMDLAGMMPDPRPKRIARFPVADHPPLRGQDVVRTEDGNIWKAVRQPGFAFLTVDYELIEVTSKDA